MRSIYINKNIINILVSDPILRMLLNYLISNLRNNELLSLHINKIPLHGGKYKILF